MSLPRTARLPYATATVVLVDLATYLSGPGATMKLGLFPAHFRLWNLVSYSFAHAGPGHLATNMALLAVFGSFVEKRMRLWHWVVVYFVGVIAGGLGEMAMLSLQPLIDQRAIIGASAGVSAVMGCAFALAFRDSRPDIWTKLARVVAPAWIIVDGLYGVIAAGDSGPAQVAVWAHVSGFLTGVLLTSVFRADPRSLDERVAGLIGEGNAGEAVTLLDGLLGWSKRSRGEVPVAPSAAERHRYELLAEAWAALGDKEQAAEAQATVVASGSTLEALELLRSYGGLKLLSADKRTELAAQHPALPPKLLISLLETFVSEPSSTAGRPSALLRLAELSQDPERSRSLLETVKRDYEGTDAADRANSRMRRP
jgi:membrane associated rhomboid family serine protease